MEEQMDSAIYYPYIKVPKNTWFARTLLYWDDIGAIVPYEYIEKPERLGPYMQGLVREGLVTQIHPGAYLWQAPNFVSAFLAHVDNNPIAQKANINFWVRVHMEKLQKIGEKLCERGLATRDKEYEYSPWYLVEPTIADNFMAYLVAVLGQLHEEKKYYPITDQSSSFHRFLPPPNQYHLTPLRKQLFEGILPAPSSTIEPAKIAEFKNRYKAELLRYRRLVEDKVSELSIIKDEADRVKRTNVVAKVLGKNVQELAARMKEQKNWPHIDFGNLCVIAGSGISAWKAIIDQDLELGLAAAALSLAPAVYSAFKGSNLNLEDKPLAYAALAKNEFM